MAEERQFSLSRLTWIDEINYFLKTGKLKILIQKNKVLIFS